MPSQYHYDKSVCWGRRTQREMFDVGYMNYPVWRGLHCATPRHASIIEHIPTGWSGKAVTWSCSSVPYLPDAHDGVTYQDGEDDKRFHEGCDLVMVFLEPSQHLHTETNGALVLYNTHVNRYNTPVNRTPVNVQDQQNTVLYHTLT